ncbi:MAG: IS21 family transposase [Actinobacteria bacterium]|nr:IS21 family transposase [Actinomycetota bacterium]
MAYREVSVIEVKEILRLWLEGRSLREVTTLAGVDRKTVRRYVQVAQAAGLVREGGAGQLTDELLGVVVGAVRPARPQATGAAWQTITGQREQISQWLEQGLTLAKVHLLLGRRGVVVPYRTLHRFASTELGFSRRRRPTVRVADGKPGDELQVDFGRLGLIPDPIRGGRRVVHGLVFTAVYSRHLFVYPTHRQSLEEVIAGFEAAWAFFGGVFKVVIPDNLKAIVDHADATDPRLNDAFREYAQARGFAVDPTRVRHPRDKPRVERSVHYVQSNFFAGEQFRDLTDCQAHAATWCAHTAGQRIHGTTCRRPMEVFTAEEQPLLLPAPTQPFAIPVYTRPKVAPDRHVEVARALYSVPGELIGQRLLARTDATTVKLFWRGQLIKVHPRQPPGHRHTDPADLPSDIATYALRDLDALHRRAAAYGEHIGAYTAALLDHPLPWTKMRQVYRLLGLVRRHGDQAVNSACQQALEAEAINVGLIDRMLTRGRDHTPIPTDDPPAVVRAASRFVRDSTEFTVRRPS